MADERRARRALATACLSIALAPLGGCFVPTTPAEAPGYDPALPSGELYRWALGRTVRVYVVPSDPFDGPDELRDATRAAAEGWSAAMYYRELTVALVYDAQQADVIVRPAGVRTLVGTAGCEPPTGEPAGSTFFCRARLQAPQQDTALTLPLLLTGRGRVKVEVSVDAAQAPAGGLASLVTHELGHALGIGAHSVHPADVMYAVPSASRPSARDASTLRWLLHQYAHLRL